MNDDKMKTFRKTMMIITIPFLYLFNISIIVMGIIFSYRIILEKDYWLFLLVFAGMVILPLFIIILNNPKKLWKAINNPLKK